MSIIGLGIIGVVGLVLLAIVGVVIFMIMRKQQSPTSKGNPCPNCGNINPQGNKFCGNCGGSL